MPYLAALPSNRRRAVASMSAALLITAIAASFGSPTRLPAQERTPRPAAEIVRDFRRVTMPSFSDGADPESIERFRKAIDDGCRAQGRFARELLAGYPRHPDLPELLRMRWAGMNNALGESAEVLAEARALLAGDPTPEVARAARSAMARAALVEPNLPLAERRELVLAAASASPGDEDAGFHLLGLVTLHITDPEEARSLLARVEKDYAGTEWAAPEAKQWRRQLDRIGTPHRESFADFRDDRPFDSDAARGPRIVHYFSPYSEGIEGELAQVARLLERHRDAGFVACGVHDGTPSQGEDGFARWLAERKVSWPMRLALPAPGAKPWETGLDLPQVPFALLIDREGKIRMVSTRIAALVPMLETLLAESPRRKERL